MGEEVKVRVENLTKCFGDLRVLDKVSFQIKKETRTIAFRTSLLFQLKCMLPPFLNSG